MVSEFDSYGDENSSACSWDMTDRKMLRITCRKIIYLPTRYHLHVSHFRDCINVDNLVMIEGNIFFRY